MRNWGIVITAFYAVIVVLLFGYGWAWLAVSDFPDFLELFDLSDAGVVLWFPLLILLPAQILLLFLSVDTSWRKLKPRRHVNVTASLVGFLVIILIAAIVVAINVVRYGDNEGPLYYWLIDLPELSAITVILGSVFLIWTFWGLLFLKFARRTSNIIDLAVSWLIKGSVLELLIAIPCHVIVRQRNDCCAPLVSAYGIATGIAIMLMAFGPGILFLYQRKLNDYRDNSRGHQ